MSNAIYLANRASLTSIVNTDNSKYRVAALTVLLLHSAASIMCCSKHIHILPNFIENEAAAMKIV